MISKIPYANDENKVVVARNSREKHAAGWMICENFQGATTCHRLSVEEVADNWQRSGGYCTVCGTGSWLCEKKGVDCKTCATLIKRIAEKTKPVAHVKPHTPPKIRNVTVSVPASPVDVAVTVPSPMPVSPAPVTATVLIPIPVPPVSVTAPSPMPAPPVPATVPSPMPASVLKVASVFAGWDPIAVPLNWETFDAHMTSIKTSQKHTRDSMHEHDAFLRQAVALLPCYRSVCGGLVQAQEKIRTKMRDDARLLAESKKAIEASMDVYK